MKEKGTLSGQAPHPFELRGGNIWYYSKRYTWSEEAMKAGLKVAESLLLPILDGGFGFLKNLSKVHSL